MHVLAYEKLAAAGCMYVRVGVDDVCVRSRLDWHHCHCARIHNKTWIDSSHTTLCRYETPNGNRNAENLHSPCIQRRRTFQFRGLLIFSSTFAQFQSFIMCDIYFFPIIILLLFYLCLAGIEWSPQIKRDTCIGERRTVLLTYQYINLNCYTLRWATHSYDRLNNNQYNGHQQQQPLWIWWYQR